MDEWINMEDRNWPPHGTKIKIKGHEGDAIFCHDGWECWFLIDGAEVSGTYFKLLLLKEGK